MTDASRKVLMPSLALAATISYCMLAPLSARADDNSANTQARDDAENGLVNIITPDILAPRQMALRLDIRTFSGDENTAYFGPGFRIGVANNWELGVGSSLSPFKSFMLPDGNTIRHGGSDVELTAKYSTHQSGKYAIAGQAGIALPNTPAQRSAHLTLGIQGSLAAASGVELAINPRTVFTTNNTIVGLGFGASVKLAKQFSLIGDYTPILAGNNTIDATTGSHRSHDVYGAALRFSTGDGNISVDLGWTNGTGFTTGSSLTPSLGGSGSLYLSLNIRH